MPLIDLNGLLTHYDVAEGEGETLLMLHGFTGSIENWAGIRRSLAVPTVCLDLPGHGRTDAPPQPDDYAMAVTAERIILLLDQLELDRVDLLGYSMGGRLAFYLAVHHADRFRSLILESTSPGLETTPEREARRNSDAALAQRIEREGIEAFVDFWEAISLFESQRVLPPATRQQHRALRLRNSPLGLANSLRGMGTGSQPSLWGNLSDISLPILLIVGALDSKYVTINQRLAGLIPHARLEVIQEAGHTVHLEQPVAYARIITQFLEET